MYEIFKNRIAGGGFSLLDIQHRMKKLYALGELTGQQLDELMILSQENAAVEAERPEILQMLLQLAERVTALEGETTPDSDAWQPWDGISSRYQPGQIVTHNGKRWKSVFAGQNVWEPGVSGTETLWVEV